MPSYGGTFSFAFQPIVDAVDRSCVSFEALIRGVRGEPAGQVLGAVAAEDLYRFDAQARAVAVAMAADLGLQCQLNLNYMPRGLQMSGASTDEGLLAAARCGIDPTRIVMEVTESEMVDDAVAFVRAIDEYRALGVKVAIDDFGAGYAGLNLLADFQPDLIKIDMNLVRGIRSRGPRQAIVRAIIQACGDLGIDVVAEGVESLDEYGWFREEGVRLFQGYLFARPGFQFLPVVNYPAW